MLQFILEFHLEKPQMPLEFDRLMVSFLKGASRNYSEDMFERLYDKSKSVIKTYTYSMYLPGARFMKETVELSENRFRMFFSDADMGQMVHWFNAFNLFRFKTYPMNNNSMKLVSIRTQNRKEIEDSEIVVRMQSPLIARRHNAEDNMDTYYTYDNTEFSDVLRENAQTFLDKLNINISTEGFQVIPIKGRKVVTNCIGRKVDGNIGIYKICGCPELLNVMYQAGSGVRRSEGHGKWEIIM